MFKLNWIRFSTGWSRLSISRHNIYNLVQYQIYRRTDMGTFAFSVISWPRDTALERIPISRKSKMKNKLSYLFDTKTPSVAVQPSGNISNLFTLSIPLSILLGFKMKIRIPIDKKFVVPKCYWVVTLGKIVANSWWIPKSRKRSVEARLKIMDIFDCCHWRIL